jgi:hypothetical protein
LEFFFERHSSGHTGSNDTGLEFLLCRGAEKKGGQTHTQTDFGYYYIDLYFRPKFAFNLHLYAL